MPRCCSQQKRDRIDQLRSVLRGKHLPGCYDRLLPLANCICGGPERGFMIEAIVDHEFEVPTLVQQSDAVG